jgi:hypothetical protein
MGDPTGSSTGPWLRLSRCDAAEFDEDNADVSMDNGVPELAAVLAAVSDGWPSEVGR